VTRISLKLHPGYFAVPALSLLAQFELSELIERLERALPPLITRISNRA
jgi:hypothetical protein